MANSVGFNTANRIIRAAMENAGLLEDGDDPTPEQYAKYLPRLNDLINLWQTQGIKLWLNRAMTLGLTAGQGVYILPTHEMRVLEGYYITSGGIRRPLEMLTWNKWNTLPDHTRTGQINAFFPDKQQTQTVISLWQVPDTSAATGTVELLVQDRVVNLVNLTETMNFPQEWFIALHWGLADEICTGQPEALVQRCATKALAYRTALEDWDVEDGSTFWQPDLQLRTSSFR